VPLFRYDSAIVERFPSVVGGIVHARGVRNGPAPPALEDVFRTEQARTLERIGSTSLAELPSLAAWRRAFSAFGVEPTRYRSAAESLLRRLTKQGEIPSLSLLVDLGNLVSIRYGLPVAVCDQRDVTGGTTVRFADGGERFTDLGAEEAVSPEPGEVIFVDDAGLVSARRWCWRQSAQSATKEDTTEILVTVEGLHEGARADVETAVADVVALLAAHAGAAATTSAVLAAAQPAFLDV
jgi:DNA/RNA-binding domain of Phe-tRNA-synthetase-like protein